MADNGDKKTHLIKAICPDMGVDDDGRSVAQVKQLIQLLDPKRIEKAGNAYVDAGGVMYKLQYDLEEISVKLASCWEGKASVEAQKALRLLHATVRELQNRLFDMGRPLEHLGRNVLPEHQRFVNDEGWDLGALAQSWSAGGSTMDDSIPSNYRVMGGGTQFGSPDELAGKHLALLNRDLIDTYELLPSEVHKELPKLSTPEGAPFTATPAGGGKTGGLGGGDSTAYGSAAGGGGAVPGGSSPGGSSPYSPAAFDPSSSAGSAGSAGGAGGVGGTGSGAGGAGAGSVGAGRSGTPDMPDVPGVPGAGDTAGSSAPAVPAPGSTPTPDPSGATPGTGQVPRVTDPNDTTALAGQPSAAVPTFPPAPASSVPIGQVPTSSIPTSSIPATSIPATSIPAVTPGIAPGMPATSGGAGGAGGGTGGYGGSPGGQGTPGARTAGAGVPGGANGMGAMPFMPMGGMGAGPGGEAQERESSTWLREDDDLWVGQTDGVVGDTIG
ncbi:hypothetical protein SAMN05421505_11085 [Sinosporangium album]|uniref:Proteins of 100 residues with WXG n=1 Tax=Sinosporangium album TaxID=504805 RepID=A0A1G7YVT7_9ACTN|nr:hypothetical protein [Sinosporangium album]SDH00628.1 hypothetical protein SAMN05421505_11085 [Sinosporangium album]